MELKPGYKESEVGVIPDDWEIRSLEQISDPKSPICYGIVQVGPFCMGGTRVLAIKNLNTDYATNIHCASKKVEAPYARSRIRGGDVLISVKGTTGRVGLVPEDFEGNISRDIARLRPPDDEHGPFWHQMLQSEPGQFALGLATVGTTRMELSIGILKQVRVARPPPDEQRAIAAALSDVDALIAALDRLIAKKRDLKQAAMQQLLTGQTRLPGFTSTSETKQTEVGELPADWEVSLLDSVAKRGSGHTPDKKVPEYWNGTIKWLSLKDSDRLDALYIADTVEKITPAGIANSSAVEHPRGTVVLSRDAGVGKSAIIADVMAVSQHFMAWQCGPLLNNHFLYYWLQMKKTEFERIAIGNTIKTIGLPYFRLLKIPRPKFAEQTAIAAVLSDMDAEIAALEARRDKTRLLKQGMMQELLTGRTRLV